MGPKATAARHLRARKTALGELTLIMGCCGRGNQEMALLRAPKLVNSERGRRKGHLRTHHSQMDWNASGLEELLAVVFRARRSDQACVHGFEAYNKIRCAHYIHRCDKCGIIS